MSFVKNVSNSNNILEIFIERKNGINDVYFLRLNDKKKEIFLKKAIKDYDCHLPSYGDILHSYVCINEKPSENIRKYIMAKYG